MPAVIWSAPARNDLRRINRWLATEADGAVAARIVLAIRDKASFLETFPHGGRPQGDAIRVVRVISTSYLILYRVERDMVQVLRVHHEREDWLVAP